MVLGMGREKLANRLGLSCDCQHPSWWARPMAGGKRSREHIFGINSNHAGKCPARKANTLADKYEEQFPAAKNTMQVIMNLAEHRGWIKTLLGRRRRYQEGDRFYSAFAGLLQGSEADVVKSKILTLYDNRKTIGIGCLRAPVHDEVVGDIEKDPRAKERFREACAESEISLKVPMIWNAEYGPNWKACH